VFQRPPAISPLTASLFVAGPKVAKCLIEPTQASLLRHQRMEASMSYDEAWFAWGVIAAVFVGTGALFWLPAIAYAWF
jgi:hypothetical protein